MRLEEEEDLLLMGLRQEVIQLGVKISDSFSQNVRAFLLGVLQILTPLLEHRSAYTADLVIFCPFPADFFTEAVKLATHFVPFGG